MYGFKYGGTIYVAATRKVLYDYPITAKLLGVKDFMGNTMNVVTPVDPQALESLKADGYKVEEVAG